jgi:WD40 repeat protein
MPQLLPLRAMLYLLSILIVLVTGAYPANAKLPQLEVISVNNAPRLEMITQIACRPEIELDCSNLMWSADGSTFATLHTWSVLLYDGASFELQAEIRCRDGYPESFAMDATAQRVAILVQFQNPQRLSICLWDRTTKAVRELSGTNAAVDVEITSDGKMLAFGVTAYGGMVLYNIDEAVEIATFDQAGSYLFTPDNLKMLMTYFPDDNNGVSIIDVNSGREVYHLLNPDYFIDTLAVNSDGSFAVLTGPGTYLLWNLQQPSNVVDLSTTTGVYATRTSFSPNDRLLALGGYRNTTEILDVQTQRTISVVAMQSPGDRAAIFVWGSDSRTLIGETFNDPYRSYREVYVWDVVTGEPIFKLEGASSPAINPSGTLLAVRTDGAIVLYGVRQNIF